MQDHLPSDIVSMVIAMETSKTNATRAIAITATLTLFVTGFEIFMAYTHYKQGMNFIDIGSYVTSNRYFYYLILIAANMILLPGAVLLFKENGISLKEEILGKKTSWKDILIGIIALALSGVTALMQTFVYMEQTDLAFKADRPSVGITIMGEMCALILFNVMFTMLDWYNFGFSFILGLICIWAYKKTGHLIAPMIVHGGINFIALVYWIVVTG